jgi:hypothetical protein
MLHGFRKFIAELREGSLCPDIARELDFEDR